MHKTTPPQRFKSTMNATILCLPSNMVDQPRLKKTGKQHTYRQDNKENYLCPYCDYSNKKMSSMSEHVRRKHPIEANRQVDPFECNYCPKKFQANSSRIHHIKTHHEINFINCPHPECDKKHKTTTELYTHYSRIHMDHKESFPSYEKGKSIKEKEKVECKHCKKKMRLESSYYHNAICNFKSPFFTGSIMCDEGGETIMFRPVHFRQ